MNEENSKFSLPWILCCVMALGSPIALVGIIVMAINTGKESNQSSNSNLNSNTDTIAILKMDTNTCKDKMTENRIKKGADNRMPKGTEQYVDQSIAEIVRTRRHLGIFQFTRTSYRAGNEIVEVV